jgi:hypothetical protein
MNANNKTGVRSVLNRSKYSFLLCCVLFTTGTFKGLPRWCRLDRLRWMSKESNCLSTIA